MPRGSSAKEVREYLRDSIRFLVLEPVRGVGKGEELSAGAIAQAFVSHFRQEKIVALAPEDAGGDADVLVLKFDPSAEEGAIPVDHAGQSAGLRPGAPILGEVFSREGARAAGVEERVRAKAEVEGGEKRFRQPGELEEKHVPTAEELTRMRAEEFAHHRRMRDVEDGELGDALRMQEGGAPGNCGAPIMAGQKDFFPTELIGDGEDVGDEFP